MRVGAEPAVDGRRARKERGRLAVTNAMIDLVFEGKIPPNAEQVAERAGVSVASIFRYFETLDDLRRATTETYFERYADLFEIPRIGEGSLPTRIDSFVSARVALYDTIEPIARLARLRASEHANLDETLHRVRASRSDQICRHYEIELRAFTPAARDDTIAIISTLTSFESWDQARHDHRRSTTQLRRAWATAIRKILTP